MTRHQIQVTWEVGGTTRLQAHPTATAADEAHQALRSALNVDGEAEVGDWSGKLITLKLADVEGTAVVLEVIGPR